MVEESDADMIELISLMNVHLTSLDKVYLKSIIFKK